MGGGGNEEDGMHNTTLVRTALFVLCAACRYSAADRDRTGDYRLKGGALETFRNSGSYLLCLGLIGAWRLLAFSVFRDYTVFCTPPEVMGGRRTPGAIWSTVLWDGPGAKHGSAIRASVCLASCHPPRSGGGRPQSTYSTVKDGVHLSDSHQFINIPTTFLDFFSQHSLEKSRTRPCFRGSFKITSRYLSSDWTNCALWKFIYGPRKLWLTSLEGVLEYQFKLELQKVTHY